MGLITLALFTATRAGHYQDAWAKDGQASDAQRVYGRHDGRDDTVSSGQIWDARFNDARGIHLDHGGGHGEKSQEHAVACGREHHLDLVHDAAGDGAGGLWANALAAALATDMLRPALWYL